MKQSKILSILLLGGVLFFGTSCTDDAADELNVGEMGGGGYVDENENNKKNETAPLSE